MKLNPSQLLAARFWVKDCIAGFRDLEDDSAVDELSDSEIERGISEHYEGGISQFVQESEPISPEIFHNKIKERPIFTDRK